MSQELSDEQKAALEAMEKAFPGAFVVGANTSTIETAHARTAIFMHGDPLAVVGLLTTLVLQASSRLGVPFMVQPVQVKQSPGMEMMK